MDQREVRVLQLALFPQIRMHGLSSAASKQCACKSEIPHAQLSRRSFSRSANVSITQLLGDGTPTLATSYHMLPSAHADFGDMRLAVPLEGSLLGTCWGKESQRSLAKSSRRAILSWYNLGTLAAANNEIRQSSLNKNKPMCGFEPLRAPQTWSCACFLQVPCGWFSRLWAPSSYCGLYYSANIH